MPIQARGWWVEKGLAMVALPFVRHSTMALAPMVTQASSPRLSSLWSSLLQEMLLHSQQLSPPRVCSPNPTFQHPALLCTRRHTTQAGVCRGAARTMSTVLCPAVHRPVVVFPSITKGPLLSQWLSLLGGCFFELQEPLLTFSSPPGVLVPSHFLFSFFLFFLLSYPVAWEPFLSF